MKKKNDIDLVSIIIPLILILLLCMTFVIFPESSTQILDKIRSFLTNEMGIYYVLLGVGVLTTTMYIAFSKYGEIKLGNIEKPEYSSFKWGSMIFTSTMAADIIFYALCEWALYSNEKLIVDKGVQQWAPTYPLFHWGPIAWGFYIILAVAFGFVIHIKGNNKQRFSEACRPILKDRVDGILGKVIDLFAIFALLAGTATTFSLATPLLAESIGKIFGIHVSKTLTLGILLIIAIIYVSTVLLGMKSIAKLAEYSSYTLIVFLLYVLIFGGEAKYILETGLSSIGNLAQNFIGLSTQLDPLRENNFPQNWTIYYWAYWMVWCVATPFFIGKISKGRTVKNVILGGYFWGIAGTYTSFIILGNYGLAKELKDGLNTSKFINEVGDFSKAIISILDTLPLPELVLIMLIVTMIALYSTTFDALTMVISMYSYKRLRADEEPGKKIKTFWGIMFILLPMALIFSEKSMYSLQSVSIIAAFPIGIIMIIIILGLFKEMKSYKK